MSSIEPLPQSIAIMKTIVLKPRLDRGDIQLIGEKIKSRLFSKLGFKPNPKNIRLLNLELYFEPFLIIGGKYAIDYCKKHAFEINVNEKTAKVFVGGKEFRSERPDPKAASKIINLTGEEYVHHEIQSYFVLDRMKREISPEKLPFAPFVLQKENSEQKFHFKSINISDEFQIGFLKKKIAKRPADVAQIIKETFDITERVITYYPSYQLTFENVNNKTDAILTINGVSGEIVVNGNKKLAVKTIVDFPESIDLSNAQITDYEKNQQKAILKINRPNTTDKSKNPPKEEEQIRHSQPREEITISGDMEIPSGTTINKNLIVKGSLKIGDNCRVHGRFLAIDDIKVGSDTIIDGDLISGGNVFVGPRSLVAGLVQANGIVEIEEDVVVEGGYVQTSTSQ
ncbi:MAG: hypothetical protein NWE84_07090 [Candidatus Bathyarchaeota archaeon]|nr:hypothetical protein [Candidatus Bathyarchaeota archaeon]